MRLYLASGLLAFGLAASGCGTPALPQEDRPATATAFQTAAVAEFDTPWAMTFLPGSANALVTEKDGRLWVVDTRSGAKTAVTGVPDVLVAGQGGLGDVVVGPGNRIYLSFVEAGPGGSGAVVGHGRLVATSAAAPGAPVGYSLQDFRIVWRQQPKVSGAGHFSHRIAFGPDGAMYLTSGDRQKDSPAQDLGGNLGKVLRLTPEGQPFPGNPMAARGGVAAEFWSIGHRNALGIAFAADGRLWSHEMGPQGGDEVNLILPGRNYGWPIVSDGSHYGGGEIPDHATRAEFEAPKVSWNPSISPSGMIVYSGSLFPAWRGDILMGALSGEALIRIDVEGDRATKAERWPIARIREVEQGPGGEVYLLEDGGRLLRLTPASAPSR